MDSVIPAHALYVHVPFCRAKCGYCDFYSIPLENSRRAREFCRGVQAELVRSGRQCAQPADSIFLGGGTPVSLPEEELSRLLALLAPWRGPETEFTVEANPTLLEESKVEILARGGVNRVAIGAQSFVPEELAVLGRLHCPADIGRAVRRVRDAGIENINLDLMFALPGQDLPSLEQSLEALLRLQPEHVSAYALSFEEGTPFWTALQSGRLEETDEDLQRRMYDHIRTRLRQAGYEHYELSNFAKPGRRCAHNLTYWHNESYLGVGPAAASYLAGVRRKTVSDLARWAEALRQGRTPPHEAEQLTGRAVPAEALMLGLRLLEGIDLETFAARYGRSPLDDFPETTSRYLRDQALRIVDNRLQLSRDALFTSNDLFASFLAEAD